MCRRVNSYQWSNTKLLRRKFWFECIATVEQLTFVKVSQPQAIPLRSTAVRKHLVVSPLWSVSSPLAMQIQNINRIWNKKKNSTFEHATYSSFNRRQSNEIIHMRLHWVNEMHCSRSVCSLIKTTNNECVPRGAAPKSSDPVRLTNLLKN